MRDHAEDIVRSPIACFVLFLAVMSLAMTGADTAHAEVRTATITDPADATPTVSGRPNNPDLASVSVSYDNTAGTVSVTQRFYNAFSNLDTSENYAFFGRVELLPANPEWKVNGAIEEEQCGYASGFNGSIMDYSYNGSKYRNSWSVSGYSGELPFTTIVESGGTQVTATASAPSLAGHDWRCINFVLMGNGRRSYLNPNSFYDEGCGCWAVTIPMDTAGTTETTILAPDFWFPGFPATRPKPESEEEKRKRAKKEREAKEKREREMTLTSRQAEKYLALGLKRHFGKTYTKAWPSNLNCNRVLSRSKRSCSIHFEGGPMVNIAGRHEATDFEYRWAFDGTGHIWLKRRAPKAVFWYYAWKLKRIDWKCARSRSVRACTKHLVVK